MYGVFFALIGLLVFEGINSLATLQENALKFSSFYKHPKNGRRMIHKDVTTEVKTTEKSAEKSDDKSSEKSNDKSSEKSNDKSSEKSNEKSNDKSSEKSNDKFSEKSNDKSSEKSNDKPTEKSTDKSNDKSEDKSEDKSSDKSSDKSEDKSLESVISAIDSGVKTFLASENKTEIINNIAKHVVGLDNDKEQKSVFRAKAEEYIKPAIIHFRNDPDNKQSVMLELNSQSLVNGIKELLHSTLVNKIMQHYSKKAAIVYRSIKTELDEPKRRNRHH